MTPEQRSRAMKRVKLKDGPLEKVVQTELRARGLRFRRHVPNLLGKPDIVFPRERVAIFVDGDFWHGWLLPKWEHKLSLFWKKKIRDNRTRDLRNFRRLRSQGWIVIRLWGHQIKRDLGKCIERIVRAL
jgi:DNA mismatch endonuclease (patch repair protein)